MLYANSGEINTCLENLKQAMNLKASFLSDIDIDRELDPVRSNKEFKTLVKEYKKNKINSK